MNVRTTSSTNFRDAERFYDNVVVGVPPACRPDLGPCLLWTRGQNGAGYGVFRLGSLRDGTRRQVLAHRFAFTLYHEREPDGVLDHLCLVPNCVNVWHTEDVTQRINLLRGNSAAAVHAAKTACPKCGGPYSHNNQGRRFCPPCKREVDRAWRARQREKQLT